MSDYTTRQERIIQLYDLMCDLSDEHDADNAYISKESHGTDIVLEYYHDHD